MILNREVSWYLALLLMIPLIIIIFKIVDYATYYTIGVTGTLMLTCYSLFFYMRRNYKFFYKTILLFYACSIIGAFLIGYLNATWPVFMMIVLLWVILSITTKLNSRGYEVNEKIQLEEQNISGIKKIFAVPTRIQENKLLLIDLVIELVLIVVCLYLYNLFR